MNYLYLRAALDPAKAGHTLKRGKQANLAYKISLGYFILRFGITWCHQLTLQKKKKGFPLLSLTQKGA
jgi:hypothetical protein